MNDAQLAYFVLLPVIDWLAVVLMTGFVRQYRGLDSAIERRNIALAIALGTTIIAVLAINARMIHFLIPPDLNFVIIAIAIGAPSLFNAIWAWEALRPHKEKK